MNNKIIITGATGFVGKRLVNKIATRYPKKEILCLVRNKSNPLETTGRKVIKLLGLKTKRVDLVTGEGLENLPKNPEVIIHLAAETDTAKKDHRVNDQGVKNLYYALGTLGPKSHFIYIGTMISVVGRINTKKPIDEKTPANPTNEYTRTKAAGEKFLINKCKKDKFRLTILTPNTIYGKGVRPNSLFDMLRTGIRRQSLPVRINWPGKSALIHVNDIVKAIIYFSKHKPKPGKPEKYLVWAENLSIGEISELMHKKMNIEYRPINLPQFAWEIFKYARRFIPYSEPVLPAKIYNQLWRAGIIVDDVVWAKTDKLFKIYKTWKPKLLKDNLNILD